MSDRTVRGQTFLLPSKKKHTLLDHCICVSLWQRQRGRGSGDGTRTASGRARACKCALPQTSPREAGITQEAELKRTVQTGRPPRSSSPPVPLSLSSVSQSPLPIPAQPSFIFRVFGDERKQLLCALSKSEWAEGRERGETEGGKIKKSGSRLDTSGEAGRKQEERETRKGEWREECRGSVRPREI